MSTPHIDHDRLKQVIYSTYDRHLMRAGNDANALDWTYHHFKHMGFDDPEWEYVQQVLNEISKVKLSVHKPEN